MVGRDDTEKGRGFTLPPRIEAEVREAARAWNFDGPRAPQVTGNHPAALNLVRGLQNQNAEREAQEAKIQSGLADIARLRNGASLDQLDQLDASERELQIALRQLQSGHISPAMVRGKIDQALNTVSYTSATITSNVAGGSGSGSAGMTARFYDTARVQAMHEEMYNSDTSYGREYRRVTNEIRERADARIETSQERDRQTKDLLGRHGIKTEHDDEVEAARKKLDAEKAKPNNDMEIREADASWNRARVDQIDAALDQARKDGKPADVIQKLEREKALRDDEFQKALHDRDEQVKAFMKAKGQELATDPKLTDEQRKEQLDGIQKEFDNRRNEYVQKGVAKDVKWETAHLNSKNALTKDAEGSNVKAAESAPSKSLEDLEMAAAALPKDAKLPKLLASESDTSAKKPDASPKVASAATGKSQENAKG
jgi:hypothetical protein